jgi:hypothetical protein
MNVSDCTVHELREVSTRDPTTYQVRAVQARGMPCQGTLCWMKEYWERRRDRPARRAANARNVLNLLKVMYINNSVNVWNDNPTIYDTHSCHPTATKLNSTTLTTHETHTSHTTATSTMNIDLYSSNPLPTPTSDCEAVPNAVGSTCSCRENPTAKGLPALP